MPVYAINKAYFLSERMARLARQVDLLYDENAVLGREGNNKILKNQINCHAEIPSRYFQFYRASN